MLRPANTNRLTHRIAGFREAVAPFEPWAKPLLLSAWLLFASALVWKVSTIGTALRLAYDPDTLDASDWKGLIDASDAAFRWGFVAAAAGSALLLAGFRGLAALTVLVFWAPLALWCAIILY